MFLRKPGAKRWNPEPEQQERCASLSAEFIRGHVIVGRRVKIGPAGKKKKRLVCGHVVQRSGGMS